MPGSIKSSSEVHIKEHQQEGRPEIQNKRIKVAELEDVVEGPTEETSETLPAFPVEFSANGTFGGGLVTFPAAWFWSNTMQRQRY